MPISSFMKGVYMHYLNTLLKGILLPLFLLSSLSAVEGKDMHAERLKFFKDKGFSPKVVYDIGAFRGNWTRQIKNIFPEAEFYLFEANPQNRPHIAHVGSKSFIAVLGNEEKEVPFYTNNSTGDSLFREKTKFYQGDACKIQNVKMTTLSKVAKEHNLPQPNLIKFDVQGAEKLVIEGGLDLVKGADMLILETKILEYNENSPLFEEIFLTLSRLGYRLLDILELHYLPTEELNEVDLLFVKKDSPLIKKGLLI